jgi:hypothetical protein
MTNHQQFITQVERDVDNYLHSRGETSMKTGVRHLAPKRASMHRKALIVQMTGDEPDSPLMEYLVKRECGVVFKTADLLEAITLLSENEIHLLMVTGSKKSGRLLRFLKIMDQVASDFSEFRRQERPWAYLVTAREVKEAPFFKNFKWGGVLSPSERMDVLEKKLERLAGNFTRAGGRRSPEYRPSV